ncbi:unnamed protein product [Withania somnifera]
MVVITYDQVREEDLVCCSICKSQIAFVEDNVKIVQNGRTGVFNSVFNVQLLDRENYLRQVNGNTVADVYCARCGMQLGLKLIAVPRPSLDITEGRFLMKLVKLVYWNDDPMFFQEFDDGDVDIDQLLNDRDGGVNVEHVPNDPDVDQLADGMDNMDLN